MKKGWKLKLIRPAEAVRVAVDKAWSLALKDLSSWAETSLVDAMVDGGLGVEGIAQTEFYRFVSSPEGLGQLGIERTEPPKLLAAYRRSFKVSSTNRLLLLRFGDMAQLKMGTPHPAAGTGHLQIESWLEWIVDGDTVQSGYVPRERLPVSAQKRIRIDSAPGGLMLPRGAFGSLGSWAFPASLRGYERKWFKDNVKKIEKAITRKMVVFLTRRLG